MLIRITNWKHWTAQGSYIRVIPYQFTKDLCMTPSELDEILYVSSPGGHMYPKKCHYYEKNRFEVFKLLWLCCAGL